MGGGAQGDGVEPGRDQQGKARAGPARQHQRQRPRPEALGQPGGARIETGEAVGIDLWRYSSDDGRSIQRALEYLTPYLLGEAKWPYKQLVQMKVSPTETPLLLLAADRYNEPRYKNVLKHVYNSDADANYSTLLFP